MEAAEIEDVGELRVLSAGYGDLEVRFDKDKPEEVERAKTMIETMLKQGYAIIVEGKEGKTHRVKKFDAKKNVYIVQDTPTEEKELPVKKTKAVAVARSAGG